MIRRAGSRLPCRRTLQRHLTSNADSGSHGPKTSCRKAQVRNQSTRAAFHQPEPFPSLLISPQSISAQGPFAETQASFINPDAEVVAQLDRLLQQRNLGVVAHFYMDAELQGTLSALKWPHVHIADSLAMGDAAVRMAEGGAKSIACLGVDFMSESVRAALDANGYQDVPVYRLAEAEIGCSLASSAEKREYTAFLTNAAKTPRSVHVVYINTSLVTKAHSHSIVPTITCTSSNVLNTILQAYAQVPDLTVWYGPDTYMGENLYNMLISISNMSDTEIRAIHPQHDRASVASLLQRFHYFKQGNCIVHHMFGDEVVHRVRESYQDAFHTAHLEVPGEMFALAMEAQRRGRGVVGSTSNILNFITGKTREAAAASTPPTAPLQFVLGTESGMITSIVRAVQKELQAARAQKTQVEIIFPVAAEAFSVTGEQGSGMEVVPGVSGGEGCSTAGGCATCPYMKMNDLDALFDLAERADSTGAVPGSLEAFLPKKRAFRLAGQDRTHLGVVPILHMRDLMKQGRLPAELVEDIVSRCGTAAQSTV